MATENDWETAGAAFHVVLPLWLAVIVHVPTATRLTVVPLSVQILGVLVENVTARPEVAVAETAKDVLTVRAPGLLNEIVWFCLAGAPAHDDEILVHDEPTDEPRKYEPLLLEYTLAPT